MATKRSLPEKRNEHMLEELTPPVNILIDRRRLGQTDLKLDPATGASASHVAGGPFDYVHLRASLPRNLRGSEIFPSHVPTPEAYFLMRRSSDGYISATGMFKAVFPWATKAQEETERLYIKAKPSTDPHEVAGNVWVEPHFALELAEEYGITDWILALLDNEPVELQTPKKGGPKNITAPPKFTMTGSKRGKKSKAAASAPSSPDPSTKQTHKRSSSLRASSPTKIAPPASGSTRPKASPRKPRAKKAPQTDSARAKDASALLQNVVEATEDDDKVRVSIQQDVGDDGDQETTRTTVKVEIPASSPDLELPKDTEGVVEKASEIVKDLKEMQSESAGQDAKAKVPASPARKRGPKRKASEALDAPGIEEILQDAAVVNGDQPAAKRTRIMVNAEAYRRDKIKRRAFMGLSGAIAVGAMIPFLSNLF